MELCAEGGVEARGGGGDGEAVCRAGGGFGGHIFWVFLFFFLVVRWLEEV